MATASLFARQSLLVGHIALGLLIGPNVLGWVHDTHLLAGIAHIGIVFLLFLLGLNLQIKNLSAMLGRSILVTLGSSLAFSALGMGVGRLFGYTWTDCVFIGASMMFSSTILGLKLLPTTVLHHRHAGEIMVSILLLQDVLAILFLLASKGYADDSAPLLQAAWLVLSLPGLVAVALAAERWLLIPLITKFDKFQEYIFLLTIGWCLGLAAFAEFIGLSHEIGAFVAGVALATNPIALFIAERLKPLRDFFLVVFFVSLGAGFNLIILPQVAFPAFVLAALMLAIKPGVFQWLLIRTGEENKLSWEMGVRLGQISEFSLLIAVAGLSGGLISAQASFLIQTATLLTFVLSSYAIVMFFPTPIALVDSLRRD